MNTLKAIVNKLTQQKKAAAAKAEAVTVETPNMPAKGESGLVFYRRMLREMGIEIPEWLMTVSREVSKKRKVFNPFRPSEKSGFVDLRRRGYTFGFFGNHKRTNPKRDKSISARQWRIRRNRFRQAVAATNGPSGLPYRKVAINRPA